MRCLTVFAIFMWLLVISLSSDYWLGIPPRVNLISLVEVEVCLGIPSCGTRWVLRGSRGLILGSTGRGRPILGSTGRGCPLLYPASVFPTVATHDNLKQIIETQKFKQLVKNIDFERFKTLEREI